MTAIVYDYPAIAAALRGDDWWEPAKIKPLPMPEVSRSVLTAAEDLLRFRNAIEEITFLDGRFLEPQPWHTPRTKLPNAAWHLLHQGKPAI